MSYSFFIAVARQVLKGHFAWQQQKVVYSKNMFGYISMKKNIDNCNSVGAEAHKVGKVASFWPDFDPNFTDVWRA